MYIFFYILQVVYSRVARVCKVSAVFFPLQISVIFIQICTDLFLPLFQLSLSISTHVLFVSLDKVQIESLIRNYLI